MRDFLEALAAPDQPMTALRALERLAQERVGHKLFTLTTVEPVTREAARVYSNMPEAYAISGRKPADETDWSRIVLRDRQMFVQNTLADIARFFPDHELIGSLGLGSVVNVPVTVGGEVIGTVNLLHEAGFYTPERVAACEDLKLPAAACFLLALNRRG